MYKIDYYDEPFTLIWNHGIEEKDEGDEKKMVLVIRPVRMLNEVPKNTQDFYNFMKVQPPGCEKLCFPPLPKDPK